MQIYAVGKSATIKAVYSYNDANLQPATLTDEFTIVGFPVPVDEYDTIDSYTIVKKGTEATGLAKNNIVMKIVDPSGDLVKDYTVELYYVMDTVQNTDSAQ